MLEFFAAVFLIFAWLIPDHYPPWSSFYNESAAALGLMLMALVPGRRWLIAKVSWAGVSVVAVALLPVLQWALGLLDYSGDAWISALYLLGFAAAIATGQVWASAGTRHSAAVLSTAALAGSLISSALALVQYLELGTLDGYLVALFPGAHAAANLGQPNNLGTLIGIGVVGLLLLREQGRLGTAAGSAALALLLVGAGATQSRTALLFGPLILLGLWLARRAGVGIKTPSSTVVAATVFHWLVTLAWPLLQTALLLSAPTSIVGRSLSTGRFAAWTLLLDAASHAPWQGFGWLRVGAAQLSVANSYPPISEKIWFHAHNLFLDFVLWCGYPLGLLLSGLVVYWLVERARKTRTLEAMTGMLVVAIFGVHAMLELPHHYAYFLIPVGLWIGQVEHGMSSRFTMPASWMLAPMVLAGVMVVEIWREYPAVEEDFRLLRFELLRIGTLRATEPAPSAPMLSSLTGFLRFARTTPHEAMSEVELKAMEASVQRYGYAPSMFRYAQALALNGHLDDAKRVFLEIRHVHGEKSYGRYRQALHEAIVEGKSGLVDLETTLPP